jgi:DNA-binding Xre family transcriptional regulator
MTGMVKLKLSELLKKRGYDENSYRQIAEEIGCDHVSLWKMMSGKPYNPSLEMIDRLCKFLKCKPGDLFEYKAD